MLPTIQTTVQCAEFKVHIFWEGHKILQNLHIAFDWHYIGQKEGEDFAKFCGFLRIYERYPFNIPWLGGGGGGALSIRSAPGM